MPDQIYLWMLWEAGNKIAGPLADIYESLLDTGEVLDDWRMANVVFLFKKDCKEKPRNYRLVSLTSIGEDSEG